MTEEPKDDFLKSLARSTAPAADPAARERALAAARVAFDDAARTTRKIAPETQGSRWLRRLSSIVPTRRNWMMDHRLSLGTAAFALLLLPVAYQLYSTTALTPAVDVATRDVAAPAKPVPTVQRELSAPQQVAEAPMAPPATESQEAPADAVVIQGAAPAAQPAPPPPAMKLSGTVADAARISPQRGAQGGGMAESVAAFQPSPAGLAPLPSGDTFQKFDESPLKSVASDPVSTFSIDVDTASYSYVRGVLNDGLLPEPEAVRIEEMLNYFPYDYPAATSADVPFRPSVAVFPTPWNAKTELLRIGIKGYVPPAAAHKAEHLVFLIDTSGSMDEPNKLPLLRRAFQLLVDRLSPEDTVAIVAYAGSAGVVLEPTKAADKAKILAALDGLQAGGSTAGAEGIELAYRVAAQTKAPGAESRVILATDGDFNVGIADPDALKAFIRTKRGDGVFLSVLGFGRGNLDDALMQALAQNGNGNASYIDNYREARKVLVEEAGGTLDTIAKDVKIQLEFNPALVSEYRLIGYETRALNREDFNNDKVDAGDVGAGHSVTALYEITPAGKGGEAIDPLRYGTARTPAAPAPAPSGDGELGFLKLRYKLPDSDTSRLIETPIPASIAVDALAKASDDDRFAAAVAAFGQKLKGSNYGGDMGWPAIEALANGARGKDEGGYRAEFGQLVGVAAGLDKGR